MIIDGVEFAVFHAKNEEGHLKTGGGRMISDAQDQAEYIAKLTGQPVIFIFNDVKHCAYGSKIGVGSINDEIERAENDKDRALEQYQRRVKDIDNKIVWLKEFAQRIK